MQKLMKTCVFLHVSVKLRLSFTVALVQSFKSMFSHCGLQNGHLYCAGMDLHVLVNNKLSTLIVILIMQVADFV